MATGHQMQPVCDRMCFLRQAEYASYVRCEDPPLSRDNTKSQIVIGREGYLEDTVCIRCRKLRGLNLVWLKWIILETIASVLGRSPIYSQINPMLSIQLTVPSWHIFVLSFILFRCASISWFQAVSGSVIYRFQLVHLRVFQIIFLLFSAHLLCCPL